MKQLILDIQPAPSPTLDNFVIARNSELVSALRLLPANDAGKRSLYLWGEPGSGRSHLLQATVSFFRKRGLHATYVPTLDGQVLEHCDVVALDDVDFLDEEQQIAAFNLFNQLRDSGRTMIISGPCAPLQLGVRDDLRTRLGWGLVYQLLGLSDIEKAEALQRHAIERGFVLPHEVVDYMLRHVRRDLPTLIGMLDALDEWSLQQKRPVTVPMLRQLLQLPLNV